MKKYVLFVFLSFMFFLTSCGISPLDSFMKEIDAGNYSAAVKIYEDVILGNSGKEQEAMNALSERLQKAIDDYNEDNKTYDEACTRLDTIEKTEILDYSEIQSAYQKLDSLKSSKTAFTSGENFLSSNRYGDAYQSFSEVIQEDTNYSAAREKMSEAKTNYVSEVCTKADSLIQSNDFSEAIQTLQDATDLIGDDETITSKMRDLTAQYRDDAISNAKAAFDKGKDYESALRIISEALSVVGEDDTLQKAKETYEEYVPVDLTSIEPYAQNGSMEIGTDGITDTLGNHYDTYLRGYMDNDDFEGGSYYVWDIGKKYSTLTAIGIAPDWSKGSSYTCSFKIYGDGRTLYSKSNISADTKPFSVVVDITGITDLKVEMYGGGNMGISGISSVLCNVMLQK
jgi:tetratricopeptide (TPR) repeat protein